ncbi:hypothetical protein EYF80_020365 [Liparis tanakae]|uniref:Uncharacterized protein n=1 Tax=Liparis tanakae TaxID=230148 RepID=A0A4Z2HWI6_9TELE|nr:hypothetical protein EYF80_020365 [Liparis tanakae]
MVYPHRIQGSAGHPETRQRPPCKAPSAERLLPSSGESYTWAEAIAEVFVHVDVYDGVSLEAAFCGAIRSPSNSSLKPGAELLLCGTRWEPPPLEGKGGGEILDQG